jgi:hypothetical protein
LASGGATSHRLAGAVLAAGLAALALAFAVGGTHTTRRLAGSNGVPRSEFVAILKPRQTLCQLHENVPEGARVMSIEIGTYGAPGPPLRTTVREGDRELLAAGSLAAGWRQGIASVPLGGTEDRTLSDVTVCIANRGPARLAFAGVPDDERDAVARIGERSSRGRVRIEYVDGRATSAWSLAGTIARRMTFGRGLWGAAAPWLALTLVLLAIGGMARALLLAGGRDGAREKPS